MPTYTRNEATVVAASLRFLVISNEMNHVSDRWSIRYFRDEDECCVRLADIESNPAGENSGIQPLVEVWRLNDASVPPKNY